MDFKLIEYEQKLKQDELSANTIEQYLRDVKQMLLYCRFVSINDINKQILIDYKEYIVKISKPSTCNNKIIIINKYLTFIELNDFKLKLLRIQKKSSLEDTLTVTDYARLLRIADRLGKTKMRLLMKVLAETRN